METVIPGRDDDKRIFNEVLAMQGAPAYVRRAQAVEAALADLLAQCQRQREDWLKMVRIRLGLLAMLAGDWQALRPLLADDDQPRVLRSLHETLAPELRYRPARTDSPRQLTRALAELGASIERFNRRWSAYLPTVDLTRLNQLRANYNRYYLLEKECSVRSHVVARQGFHPLPPLTLEELLERMPALPRVQLAL